MTFYGYYRLGYIIIFYRWKRYTNSVLQNVEHLKSITHSVNSSNPTNNAWNWNYNNSDWNNNNRNNNNRCVVARVFYIFVKVFRNGI